MFKNTMNLLQEYERLGVPGFDLSVYYKGKEVLRDFRGVRDESGSALTGNEFYNLYSASKVITCVSALKLIQEGKLSLNDDLAEYIPAFKDMTVKRAGAIVKAEKKITIAHLFTMTAGLNYVVTSDAILEGIKETEGKCPTVEMMKYIAKSPLEFEPGENWQYSLCHDVLAAVVEVVSGERFGEYVRNNIFKPLGMLHSTFLLDDNDLEKLLEQYHYYNDRKYVNIGKKILNYKFGSLYESGGAGMISTVDDYKLFLEGVRTGKVISDEMRQLMQTDMLTSSQRPSCWVAQGYGYGLGVRVPKIGSLRTDYGWGGAAGAYCAIDEKNEISIFYAQHVVGSINSPLNSGLIEAVKLDLGLEADEQGVWRGDGSHLA